MSFVALRLIFLSAVLFAQKTMFLEVGSVAVQTEPRPIMVR